MDDSCAVCADALEWVAYGPCGHREVCSTCVARLRFICEDHRCCICKLESKVVFVTKALGDYTRMINDFLVLPSEPREGRMGSYWHHEDTQAFFDDVDHYKMIKAMCRLSCSVCDKTEDQPIDGSKRRGRFRNIDQLKGHLFHRHRLSMCNLCLEGRKVFICEQRLYTRAQLNQHISTGDSEVDGSESERGGFMGHPMCEFCRTPFYGDNELYTHMSTEHYTCHICQRLHPGQYEYYKNYDDLEIHFRQAHFLCEDEECLTKKFVVFQSEAEMKRHNTIEHGGKMSRSKRNAALQLPTSFRYSRNNEQDRRRGRAQTFRRDSPDNQLSMAIQASLETANGDGTFHDSSQSSFSGQVLSEHSDTRNIDPLIQPLELLSTTDPDVASLYLQALGQTSRNAPLGESSFPPLSIPPCISPPRPKHDADGLPSNNTMAARLRRQRKVSVLNSAQGWPAANQGGALSSSNPTQSWPAVNDTHVISRGPVGAPSGNLAQAWPSRTDTHVSHGSGGPPSSTLTQAWPAVNSTRVASRGSGGQARSSSNNGPSPSSYSSTTQPQVQARSTTVHGSASSLRESSSNSRVRHSASTPSLVQNGFIESSVDFPPVSAAQVRKVPASNKSLPNVEDVQTANKSLVQKIQAVLEFDPDRYAAFKDISAEYRQGLIDTEAYLYYVQQFGLSHLVLELARLCPDPQRQKELIETYNTSLQSEFAQENGFVNETIRSKDKGGTKKGKGKSVDAAGSNSSGTLADSVISSVRELQSSFNPSQEEVEVLSKDGYRAAKGKAKVTSNKQQFVQRDQNEIPPAANNTHQNTGGGGSKQRKKTSKFHRVRLGDGSVAAPLDKKNSEHVLDPDPVDERLDSNKNTVGGLPVRGVWRKGGGNKLFP